MNFNWNEDTIRWYRAANEYTGFYKNIAETITPMLAGQKSLCDLGCGLGLVDLELAAVMEQIDCVDKNEAALSALKDCIAHRGIKNIRPRLLDCTQLSGEWDVAYMSFFGSRELDRFLPHCKKLIAVVGISAQPMMVPSKHRDFTKNTVERTEQYLTAQKIKYKLTNKQFEFGQPLESMNDTRRFILAHSPKTTQAELDEFLALRLIKTERKDYPFFIPRAKAIGIFQIDGVL